MKITIITPEKELYNGTANLVQLPGSEGLFAVLPGHDKLISTLVTGEIRIVQDDNQTVMIPVKGGVVEVLNDKIVVLSS
jgi:F-type H+-transporting ATPase subunit epsilon